MRLNFTYLSVPEMGAHVITLLAKLQCHNLMHFDGGRAGKAVVNKLHRCEVDRDERESERLRLKLRQFWNHFRSLGCMYIYTDIIKHSDSITTVY